jgi:hypothetical protein
MNTRYSNVTTIGLARTPEVRGFASALAPRKAARSSSVHGKMG